MDVPAFKVASFELVDLPLIRRMAETGRPLIISTGMATEAEIDEAVAAARGAGATEIALLKCTSAYPSPPEAVNLRAIPAMAERWGVPVGLSDHTLGEVVPRWRAVALGACIVEKHIDAARTTTRPPDCGLLARPGRVPADGRRDPGRRAGARASRASDRPTRSRRAGASGARCSSSRTSPRASVLTGGNVRSIRPADGLHTRHYEDGPGPPGRARDRARDAAQLGSDRALNQSRSRRRTASAHPTATTSAIPARTNPAYVKVGT